MSGDVNVKIKQTINNVKLRNSSIKNRLRLRFTLPTNVIINLKARQKLQKSNSNTNTEATQSLKVNGKEIKGESNDK